MPLETLVQEHTERLVEDKIKKFFAKVREEKKIDITITQLEQDNTQASSRVETSENGKTKEIKINKTHMV